MSEDAPLERNEALPGYEILARVGEGSMGVVYKARQKSLDRLVAVKVLYPRLAKVPGFVDQFFAEARALPRLSHPGIVAAFDVGTHRDLHYMIMEYVDGKTVEQVLKRGGAIDERRSLQVGRQIAQALECAQRHGLVHRDVKPSNVMVMKGGGAKLCDLGFAVIRTEATHGKTVGTPDYISPEQARGESEIDIRSDIYSLGATLFHMVTGGVPFPAEDVGVVIAKHLNEKVRSPISLKPELSADTSRLIEKMMEKRREDRPQLPGDVIRTIDEIIKKTGGAPAPVAPPMSAPRPAPARPAPARPGVQRPLAAPPGPGARRPLRSRVSRLGLRRRRPR